ncbi:ubiquitin-conjugating enzyme [Vigna angularis]|uniref:Ubiquitin-conjugating enzyme n=1 Tax=Phaseolus angularis TaxID=3914 RepID=A0A8T0LDS1_PHAAN|nr:ubiquitin-conjugating enzyme [Vigna angularis]
MDPMISDSDWEISSDSNSSEDQEEMDFLYGGKAQSILSSLEETIGRIDDFLSFERAFVHGDVVCSLSDLSGRMGRVTSVDVFVDLENVKGKVIKNVNSRKLLRIRSISEGDYVIKGPWLGRVQRVVDKVTVLFDDGDKCDITALEREKFLPLTGNFPEDSQYPYYPGQRVEVKSSNSSKPTRWLCDTWKRNRDEGTVCAVQAGMVYVNWISSVLMSCNLSVSTPQCWQASENLTVLSCFSNANWHLGDWCMLSVVDQEEEAIQHPPISDLTMEQCVSREYKRNNFNSHIGELFIIGKIKTKVDVVWQNGEHTLGLDPENLLPVNVINNHEFWPHQFVLEKGASDYPLKSRSQRWGVVQCMDAKERTVKVQWKTISISNPDRLTGEKLEETVSAYELVEHPDYSCFFGDIMFKAAQKQLGNQADKETEKSVTDVNAEAVPKNGNQIGYQDEFPDNYFMSCIGNVTGFKDGNVEVTWATGFTTKVAPYEILRIEKHEDSTAATTPYETNVEELTREMIEHESLSSDQKGKDLLNGDVSRENGEKNIGECSSFSFPRAAFELFSSVKASIFQTLSGALLSGAVSALPTFEKENEYDFVDKKDLETCDIFAEQHPMTELQSTEDKSSYPENIKTCEKNDLFPFSLDTNSPNQFKQFDVIENCPDHHFFDEGKGLSISQVKRGWVKKVQQEWSILERNLPETIYVRVFEERMDLMRAAIVGASGTPYQEGLFFFDICFPPEYPNEPPHFEELVEEHFRNRSQNILLACKACLEGASIGCVFGTGKSEDENLKGTSAGFKIMLAKLFPKLVEAFCDKGIDCSQFVNLQK